MQENHLAKIESDIRGFVRASYPEMTVRVEHSEQDPSRIAIIFIEKRFEGLYCRQRYHYLLHLIPKDYRDKVLGDAIWFELTPGEDMHMLAEDPDEELIESITPEVLGVLEASGFFSALDNLFCLKLCATNPQTCSGDFRHARQLLQTIPFEVSDWSDLFHVLMGQGAFCDCEIFYNVASESRLKANHWRRHLHDAQVVSQKFPTGK